jgi:hypothetical protein
MLPGVPIETSAVAHSGTAQQSGLTYEMPLETAQLSAVMLVTHCVTWGKVDALTSQHTRFVPGVGAGDGVGAKHGAASGPLNVLR